MNDKKTSLKYFIINLIEEMDKKNIKAYDKSMGTILKGKEGPIANEFKNSMSFGKAPDLSKQFFEENMNDLIDEGLITKMHSLRGKVYYKKLSKSFISNRDFLNKLFDIPNYYNNDRTNDTIDDYFPQRNPTKSDVFSKTGEIEIETLSHKNKTVEYESEVEKMLITNLVDSEYIKDIVEQPVVLSKGKNNDRHYIPDFLIQTYHNHLIIIEVKCLDEMTTNSVLNNYKLLEKFAFENDMIPAMVTYHVNQWLSLKNLSDMKTNIVLESRILNHIHKNNKITNEEYKEIIKNVECNDLDIHHIILKNNLKKKGKWDCFYIEK
jgi:hypothetical protein